MKITEFQIRFLTLSSTDRVKVIGEMEKTDVEQIIKGTPKAMRKELYLSYENLLLWAKSNIYTDRLYY